MNERSYLAYTVTGGRQRNKEFCAHNIFENLIMLMEIISIIKERLKVLENQYPSIHAYIQVKVPC
jgi:hypothetical protein